MITQSLSELSAALAKRALCAVEVTKACLAQIAATDDQVGAFLKVDEQGALEAAKASDARSTRLSPLDGVPLALKDMILTAGFNVYPAELERVLCMHPAVALAAVGGIADEAKGELAKAYVLLRPEANLSREDLIAFCRQHLAAYKVPRSIQFVSEVPMTSSGKLMRRLLKDIDDGTR